MAANFIEANKQHDVIRQAIRGAQLLREAETQIAAALAGMSALKDGDGSLASHFALMATECDVIQNGYASANAAAKTLFDETNSVAGNAVAGIAAAKQLCAFLGVKDVALIDSLISYWPMDEASGDALDAHGSNDLTDTNTVGAGAGIIDGARDFESGNSEYFTHSDNSDLSTGNIDFSLQVWVKLESKTGTMVIVEKWLSAGFNFEYILFYDNTSDRFIFGASATGNVPHTLLTASTFGSPSTATWYLIHCWHDATADEIGIAVNAGTADTTSHAGGVYDSTSNFTIGRNDDGTTLYFDGLIDEVGFWKKVLTSGERTELYNAGAGLAYPFSGGGGTFRAVILGGGVGHILG